MAEKRSKKLTNPFVERTQIYREVGAHQITVDVRDICFGDTHIVADEIIQLATRAAQVDYPNTAHSLKKVVDLLATASVVQADEQRI